MKKLVCWLMSILLDVWGNRCVDVYGCTSLHRVCWRKPPVSIWRRLPLSVFVFCQRLLPYLISVSHAQFLLRTAKLSLRRVKVNFNIHLYRENINWRYWKYHFKIQLNKLQLSHLLIHNTAQLYFCSLAPKSTRASFNYILSPLLFVYIT